MTSLSSASLHRLDRVDARSAQTEGVRATHWWQFAAVNGKASGTKVCGVLTYDDIFLGFRSGAATNFIRGSNNCSGIEDQSPSYCNVCTVLAISEHVYFS
jgi:hypothetical protein